MKYAYIRAEVEPPDPKRVNLLNGLVEKTTGEPQPDIVPHADPGGISFQHAFLDADDDDDAYDKGHALLPPRTPGTVMNDYVICLEGNASPGTVELMAAALRNTVRCYRLSRESRGLVRETPVCRQAEAILDTYDEERAQ